MRHLFIINPAAGRPESTARLEPCCPGCPFPTRWPILEAGDAQRLAATAVRTGAGAHLLPAAGTAPSTRWSAGAAGFDNAAVTCVPADGNDFLKLFGPRFRELFYTWRPWPPAPAMPLT